MDEEGPQSHTADYRVLLKQNPFYAYSIAFTRQSSAPLTRLVLETSIQSGNWRAHHSRMYEMMLLP